MKFVRFKPNTANSAVQAVLENNRNVREISGDLFGGWEYTGNEYELEQGKLLAPFIPNSIIGVGRNYVAPGEAKPESLPEIPVFFYKPLSSLIGPDDEIVVPAPIDEVKFESELAVIIGKKARFVEEADAMDYVFGYTVANDVTATQFIHPDGHWTVGKSFDTFTPLGPSIVTDISPFEVVVQASHNHELKQNSPLSLMILSIPFMISYLSKVMTLQPGDVLLTGSPAGAGMMKAGDRIDCIIEEIGTLSNPVVKLK